jgi:hypothetical protein
MKQLNINRTIEVHPEEVLMNWQKEKEKFI